MRAGWTASGVCISGSTAPRRGATRRVTGCAIATVTVINTRDYGATLSRGWLTVALDPRAVGELAFLQLTGGAPMKAAVLHAPHQPLTIEDVSLTKPKGREVLLRTAYAGLCHSDLHFIEGLYPHPTPCVLGHESAAIVEAVGDGVTYVKPGDHVITCLSVFCGPCSQCVTGHPNLCENTDVKMLPGVSRRMTWKGGELMNQFLNLSSFGEQMLVHENSMVKIDDDIPLDRGALVGCGVMTGVGAVFNAAKVEPGATVAVIGCGGVGLSAVNGAALAGAERIIAIDRVPSKLELAREMGATDTVNASNVDAVEQILDMTKGGVHYSFEAIGTKATAEQSFQLLRPGGTDRKSTRLNSSHIPLSRMPYSA